MTLLSKGGMTMARSIETSFYNSKKWRKVAASYKLRQGSCERCRAKGLVVPAVIVHHREHLTPEIMRDPRKAYDFANLEALCQECHNKEHFEKLTASRRYHFDKNGNLVIND
jgi:5-methylcytosine-specific restriction endonuclease McrA